MACHALDATRPSSLGGPFFLPYRQQTPAAGELNVYVRSNVPPERIVSMIRPLVARIDGTLPVENLQLMTTQAQATVALDRLIAVSSGGFAALATFLAAIGLFGMLSYTVMQQRREIGVRIALGATSRDVTRLVVGQGIALAAVGAAFGLAGAFGVTRLLRSLLYGVEPTDPVTLIGIVVVLVLSVLAASWIPARRAAGTPVVDALRGG